MDDGGEKVNEMKELAATSNGLKAMCTVMAHEGIEDCRKSCGGNGYLMASGIALQVLYAMCALRCNCFVCVCGDMRAVLFLVHILGNRH